MPGSAQLPLVPDPRPVRLVRERLATSRRSGLGFDEGWREAVAGVPSDWRSALRATRGARRAGFQREGGEPLLRPNFEA